MLAKDVTRRPFTLNISKSYTYTLELFLFQKKKKSYRNVALNIYLKKKLS